MKFTENQLHNKYLFWGLVIVCLAISLWLRVYQLDQRVMHGDEAVHAIKFGYLLENDYYEYDPEEYHGPTLNYLTLISTWLQSKFSLEHLDEFDLRIIPAISGFLCLLILCGFMRFLGKTVTLFALALCTLSPAMVFFSRYYIQEMLLVLFTMAAFISFAFYTKHKNYSWAFLSGVCIGLMHATKETCIIAYGAFFITGLSLFFLNKNKLSQIEKTSSTIFACHGLVSIITALLISALFFSSFFSHSTGVIDSFATFETYFLRAQDVSMHQQPWYYYLEILFFTNITGFDLVNGITHLILFLIGLYASLTNRIPKNAYQFIFKAISIYTLLILIIYSLLPYKTPWCMLNFYIGILIIAALGCWVLFQIRSLMLKSLFLCLSIVFLSSIAWQSWQYNFLLSNNPDNPFVYAHPTPDVLTLCNKVEQYAKADPKQNNIAIQIICKDSDYWPMPWYLRTFPNIGYWPKIESYTTPTPIVIFSPEYKSEIINQFYNNRSPGEKDLYVPLVNETLELRPGIGIDGMITMDLKNNYIQLKSLSP